MTIEHGQHDPRSLRDVLLRHLRIAGAGELMRGGIEQQGPVWNVTESLRLENLTNRSYVGSVIVNETNRRYFEPEPGRTVYLMVSVSHR